MVSPHIVDNGGCQCSGRIQTRPSEWSLEKLILSLFFSVSLGTLTRFGSVLTATIDKTIINKPNFIAPESPLLAFFGSQQLHTTNMRKPVAANSVSNPCVMVTFGAKTVLQKPQGALLFM